MALLAVRCFRREGVGERTRPGIPTRAICGEAEPVFARCARASMPVLHIAGLLDVARAKKPGRREPRERLRRS